MIPKEIRLSAKRLREIRELMIKYEESNESQFIRELIEIGYAVKKSQLEESKGKTENWEVVYQDAAAKMIECHHLIRQSFSFNYDANLSEYGDHKEELKANEISSENYIETLLSGDVDIEKIKGAKDK
jgi:hypothetical protein